MKRLNLLQKIAPALLFAIMASPASQASSSITLGSTAGASFVTLPSLPLDAAPRTQASSDSSSGALFAAPSLNVGATINASAEGGVSWTATAAVPASSFGSIQIPERSGAFATTGTILLTAPPISTTAGVLTINTGSLQLSGTAAVLAAGGTLQLTGCTVVQTGAGVLTITGPTTSSGVLTLNSGSLQLSGNAGVLAAGTLQLTGGTLVQTGAGVLTIAGPTKSSGVVTINSGFLQLSGNAGVLAAGTLQLTGGTLVQAGNNVLVASGTFTNSGVIATTAGTLQISGNTGVPIVGGTVLLTTGTIAPSKNYALTASSGGNGTISPSGIVRVTKGASKTYVIIPASGYAVSQVTVDGVKKGAVSSYTFANVNAAHTITATFAPLPAYTLTASSGANGAITPSGAFRAIHGTAKTYAITPASGYAVSQVIVDGVRKGPLTSYTFANVTASHTIAATFVAKAAKSTKPAAAPNPASIDANSEYFSVSSLAGWQNTGVAVLKGQDLEVDAYGSGTAGAGGALLGAIVPPGGSAIHAPVFLVGDDYKAPVKTNGRLWLRLNESDPSLKGSAVSVLVKIQHAPSGE